MFGISPLKQPDSTNCSKVVGSHDKPDMLIIHKYSVYKIYLIYKSEKSAYGTVEGNYITSHVGNLWDEEGVDVTHHTFTNSLILPSLNDHLV